ncbi:MAG: exosortase C-terminal domain/associated protein EpsI [Planctomycetota bacterium]
MSRTREGLSVRLWALAIVLAAGAAAQWRLARHLEELAPEPLGAKLSAVPYMIGKYEGQDVELSASVVEVLGAQDYIRRLYRSEDGDAFSLYVGYFGELGDARHHSPQVCYPGAGWAQVREEKILAGGGGDNIVPANVLVFEKEGYYQAVVNWFVQWGRPAADVQEAKWRKLLGPALRRRGIVKVQIALGLTQGNEIERERLEPVVLGIQEELERLLPADHKD